MPMRRIAVNSRFMTDIRNRRSGICSLLWMIVICIASSPGWAQKHTQVHARATVEMSWFGSLEDGTTVDMLTLKNARGATAKVITYGATLTELWIPDRNEKLGDIVLGFDKLPGYVENH